MADPTLRGIAAFHLVTADPDRLAEFYRDALGFRVEGGVEPIPAAEMELLGLEGGGSRRRLRIGEQWVVIDWFERAGQPYPSVRNAASPFFQHLALVVIDMHAAYERLRMVTPITRGGPRMLPHSSGGVTAFKFRDPDGHPLELLEFPDAEMPKAWREREPDNAGSVLGIDHSAISVSDAERSAGFYERLGLRRGEAGLNQGLEQEHLDGLDGVRVAVLPMRPEAGTPHLELLGYQEPPTRGDPDLRPNDVAATRIRWRADRAELLRDPDGHLHQLDADG